jgi:hypothetical protein
MTLNLIYVVVFHRSVLEIYMTLNLIYVVVFLDLIVIQIEVSVCCVSFCIIMGVDDCFYCIEIF